MQALLLSLEDNLYRLFVADSKRAYRIAFAVVMIAAAAATALMLSGGAAFQRPNCGDPLHLLDFVWRYECGQKPHTDFYDYLGPTSFLPVFLGVAIGGCNCNAFAYGPAVLLPVVALLAWWLARRRFPAFAAGWIAAMIGGLLVGIFPLGSWYEWRQVGYSMCYNRFQWSLLCMLILVCFVAPRQTPDRRTSLLEGLLAGILTGLLLVGKINYFLAAILVLAAGVMLRRRSILSWTATFACAVTCLVSYLVYLHGDVAAWHRDLANLAGVQQSGRRIHEFLRIFQNTLSDCGFVVLIAALHLRRVLAWGQACGAVTAYGKGVAGAFFLGGLGIVVCSANMQHYDVPLWALAATILAEATRQLAVPAGNADRQSSDGHVESYRLRVCLSYLFAGMLALGFAVADFGSVAYAYGWKYLRGPKMPSDAHIAAPPLQDMLFPPDRYDPGDLAAIRASLPTSDELRDSTYRVGLLYNDGLALLRDRVDQNSRIFTLDAINPFPFALQLPAPREEPCCWHVGRHQDDLHHPAAAALFEDVTHVMIPKVSGNAEELSFLHRTYDAYLQEHFVVVAESRMWTLLVRKVDK